MKLNPSDSAARARAATPAPAQPAPQTQNAAAPQPAKPSVPDTFSKPSGGGLFGDIIKGAGKVLHTVEHGVSDAVHTVGDLFKNDREKLKESTQPFRDALGNATALKSELSKMDPKDPRYGETKAKWEAAEGKLQQMTGYTSDTAPKPGRSGLTRSTCPGC